MGTKLLAAISGERVPFGLTWMGWSVSVFTAESVLPWSSKAARFSSILALRCSGLKLPAMISSPWPG